MVPDAPIMWVPEMADTPPAQNNYAIFIYTRKLVVRMDKTLKKLYLPPVLGYKIIYMKKTIAQIEVIVKYSI